MLRGFSEVPAFLELPEGTLCSTQLRVAGIETKTLEKDLKLLSTHHPTSKTLDPSTRTANGKRQDMEKTIFKSVVTKTNDLNITATSSMHTQTHQQSIFFCKFCKL